MGKNQGYKAMQRARVGSSSDAPGEIEDGMVDGSFHTPEWHAARLASLKTTHTITWEEYKNKQKEEELKQGELEADTDKLMREYRAQLDAERAMKLSKGRNYSSDKSKKDRKERDTDRKERDHTDRKDRDSKKKKSKKRKHSRRHSSDSSSSSESSCSDDEEESRRSRSSSKRSKRDKKHSSRSKHSSKSKDDADGPVPLSKFFGSLKS